MPCRISTVPKLAYPSPSVRNSKLFSAIERLGNEAMSTLISSTIVQRRTAWRKFSSSNCPSAEKNWARLSEAKLHAVSSRNMYSEQGLEALIRPFFGQVCHSLMVVSYCVPGSAQIQAAQAI